MIRKTMIAASATALLASSFLTPAFAAESKETYRLMELFATVFEKVRAEYVEPVKDEDLVEAALNGMLSSLDPHSSYLNAKNAKDMDINTKGEFGGLGIEVTMENGWVKVVSPIDDTPAFRAGLQPGDFITHLDGEPVQGLSLSEAVDRMRGMVNTDIKLTVRRNGSAPFDVKLTRAVIKIQTVRSHAEGKIGYVRITQFSATTDTDLRKHVEALKKDIGKDLGGFVVDLRNNPGGLLDQAIAVSDDFLDKGEIVSTRSRRPEDTQRYNAKPGDITGGLPVVLLVNDGSASASEIVAGALQDHKRAVVMGTQSFGKGSVQTVLPLPGNTAIKLTTARYYTPSGRSIQAKGIVPDIIVEESANGDSAQRIREADLERHLENDKDKVAAPAPAKDAAKPQGKAPAKPKTDNGKEEGEDAAEPPSRELIRKNDYQLNQAFNLLKGLQIMQNRP